MLSEFFTRPAPCGPPKHSTDGEIAGAPASEIFTNAMTQLYADSTSVWKTALIQRLNVNGMEIASVVIIVRHVGGTRETRRTDETSDIRIRTSGHCWGPR